MGSSFDPSSYRESGDSTAPYAVERDGASTPSGGAVQDGGTYGGLSTQ